MIPRARRLGLVLWLAWRSALTSPRDTALRAVVGSLTVVAVLLGCALTPTALNRSDRIADAQLPLLPATVQDRGLMASQTHDYFDGEPIEVVTVAQVGGSAPSTFEGVPVPGPGEVTVSPQLAEDRETFAELALRYPGEIAGYVPSSFLLGPHSRVVWRAVTPEDMPAGSGWLNDRGSGWLDDRGGSRNEDVRSSVPDALSYAYPVLALGFVLPLLALVAVLASLGASRRERRLAALRLVGLSDGDAKRSVALEEAVTSVFGVVVGTGIFFGAVPLVSSALPAQGGVWAEDVTVSWPAAALFLGSLPLVSVVISQMGLRSVTTSALSVERRSSSRRPGNWRLLPLALGLVVLGLSLLPAFQGPVVGSATLFAATALLSVGVTAGLPVLVRALGVRMRHGSLSALLAAAKLEADPAKSSRVAAGLTMLLIASGFMLLFFPMISESDSDDFRVAGDRLGATTLFGFQAMEANRAEAVARQDAWGTVERSPAVRAALQVRQVLVSPVGNQNRQVSILTVGCTDLALIADVAAEDCAKGLVTRTGMSALPGGSAVQAVRESDSPDDARLESLGAPFELPTRPVESDVVAALEGVANTGAEIVVPTEILPEGVPLAELPATTLISPRTGALETARTELLTRLNVASLTFDEQFRISTLSTRQYQSILWLASLLVVAIAGLATMVATHEMVRSTRPERRLLAVGGVRRRVQERALTIQTMVPVSLGVVGGTLATLAIAHGFVGLLADQGGVALVPVSGVLITAAVAWAAPAMGTVLILRTESQRELLQSPE